MKHKHIKDKDGMFTCSCKQKQTVFMPMPKHGATVWVNEVIFHDIDKSVRANVFSLLFKEPLGHRSRDQRWILVRPEKGLKSEGLPWKPEHVFDCQLAAEKNLQNRMLDKIVQIEEKMKQLDIW